MLILHRGPQVEALASRPHTRVDGAWWMPPEGTQERKPPEPGSLRPWWLGGTGLGFLLPALGLPAPCCEPRRNLVLPLPLSPVPGCRLGARGWAQAWFPCEAP